MPHERAERELRILRHRDDGRSDVMTDRWYSKAVIYCLDIDTFADSNGDGVGDIPGLIGRLDYLAATAARCSRGSSDHSGAMLFLHNLGTDKATVDLGELCDEAEPPTEVLADQDYPAVGKLDSLDIDGCGYRWLRLRRDTGYDVGAS